MRLGLLADIHEAVESLRRAVNEMKARRVDAFVILGDVSDQGERIDETVAILAPLVSVGVWGNHDFGLCGEVQPSIRSRFSPVVLEYFSRMSPRADLAGCRFQHIDPHLDPESFGDLWQFPTMEERIAGMGRCSHARVFVGHLHRWALVTPEQEIPWKGEEVLQFEAGTRYLTVVNAVVNDWCAILDTERDELEAIRVV